MTPKLAQMLIITSFSMAYTSIVSDCTAVEVQSGKQFDFLQPKVMDTVGFEVMHWLRSQLS